MKTKKEQIPQTELLELVEIDRHKAVYRKARPVGSTIGEEGEINERTVTLVLFEPEYIDRFHDIATRIAIEYVRKHPDDKNVKRNRVQLDDAISRFESKVK